MGRWPVPLLVTSLLLLTGCSTGRVNSGVTALGEPDDRWRVLCESSLKPRPNEGEDPETAVAKGWIAARTPGDYEIEVHGKLEDGFVQVLDVYSEDPEWELDRAQPYLGLRKVCRQTMANRRNGTQYRAGLVRASHEANGIYTSFVFDAWAERDEVTRVIVFGDSLSDTGNLKRRLKMVPRPPYWVGRFANGPVWTDYLEVTAGLAMQNHARGGAMATQREPMASEELIQRVYTNGQFFVSGNITHQIEDYASLYLNNGTVQRGESSVAILWAGANDYISKEAFDTSITALLGQPFSEEGYREVVANVVEAMEKNLLRLKELGLQRFMVINLPDLGLTPMVLYNDSFVSSKNYASNEHRLMDFSSRLSELTRWHNLALAQMVDRFQSSSDQLEVLLVDSNELFAMVNDPEEGAAAMGFDLESMQVVFSHQDKEQAFQDSCYKGMTLGVFSPSSQVCQTASRTVFWDLVHPTTYFHCWMAFWVGNQFYEQGWTGPMPDMEQYRGWCETAADSY